MPLKIGAIVGVSKDWIIGVNNGLPWGKMSKDMKHFRAQTTNQIVIMGHKTFKSMGSKPLPNRHNIVLSTSGCVEVSPEYTNIQVATSIKQALEMSERLWLINGGKIDCAYFIGGEGVYSAAISMGIVDFIDVTLVDTWVFQKEGTDEYAYFDKTLISEWDLQTDMQKIDQDENNVHPAQIVRFVNPKSIDYLSRPIIDINPWINIKKTGKLPEKYGDYEVYRKGADKQHYEVWNNTGWAYNNNDITHWRKKLPPTD
jgi:dihydrofolate reductase